MQMKHDKHVIVGLGQTGYSCARYLHSRQLAFSVMDTREAPPALGAFRAEFPQVKLSLGGLDADELAGADVLVVSPGVDLRTAPIARALQAGARVSGDIDLFAREVTAPVIAITGSNAKSTVTTMVGDMARAEGLKVAVAGNIGTPVLDLLREAEHDLYVLELSSFQLETTHGLGAEVATILNLSEDHMDRYASMAEYRQAKQRIFDGCRRVVVNRDDPQTEPPAAPGAARYSFGLDQGGPADSAGGVFHILAHGGEEHLACDGEPWLPVSRVPVAGRHNVLNALAALAIGHAAGFKRDNMLAALTAFRGLRHRCQKVAEVDGVAWFNDSKGTNVGATVAAISGLGTRGRVILLAGGQGKGADFSGLGPAMAQYGRAAVLFGTDAPAIAAVLRPVVRVETADTMQDAVNLARAIAEAGDQVLLSPACASFDMFRDYQHRGEVFEQAVEALH